MTYFSKALAVGLLFLLPACNQVPCNPTKQPVELTDACRTGGYRDWQDWLVTYYNEKSNVTVYCRGSVRRDVELQVGQRYFLEGFKKDTDL